ncbi:hypothetical protein EV175_006538, partial [Coemansia sp. RSA 1933]
MYGPDSDKVFLPASFLKHSVAKYTEAHMLYPLTVRIPSRAAGAKTVYCGVRDFDSEEGRIGLPTGLLEQLPMASDGAVVTVEYVVLAKGMRATFKAFHSDKRKQSGCDNLRDYLKINVYVGIIADAADAVSSVSAGFKGSISVLASQDELEIDTVSANGSTNNEDTLLCSNCNAGILKGNFEIHRLVCERHNYRYKGCKSVLRLNGDEARNHWHCDLCHIPDKLGDEGKHVHLFHTPCKCTFDNGELEFDSVAEFVKHRRTD